MESVITLTNKNEIKSNLNNLDKLIGSLEGLRDLASASDSASVNPATIANDITQINENNLDNYKLIKRIDKSLNSQPQSTIPTVDFNHDYNLNKAIAAYLLRLGWLDVFNDFCSVYKIAFEPSYINKITSLNTIINQLKSNNLASALDWANHYQHPLNSPLLFYLHRSKFSQFNSSLDSLNYFKQNLSPYLSSPQFSKPASSLLASLAFKDLANSPYSYLTTDAIHSNLLVPTFEHSWCTINDIPKIDHLKLTLDIGGGSALPILSRFNQLIQKTRTEWSQSDELPVQVPLQDKYKFHSVFTCPISKEQTTDTNPPMMLSCGHVLANDSLSKLSKGGGRVKCPYCPAESQSSAALRLYF